MKPHDLLPSFDTKPAFLICLLSALLCLFHLGAQGAEDSQSKAVTGGVQPTALSDLTLGNFFDEGWSQPWSKFDRGDGTPDMSLLRVQTNFLVQLFRLDTAFEVGRTSPAFSQGELVTGTLEYALDRRFMPGLFVNQQWLKGRNGPDDEGGTGGVFSRVQLIETRQSSLALVLKMTLPDRDIHERLTDWSYALAGWEDLAPLGLGRTGLYYHAQHEIYTGPGTAETTRNDTTYDISLATTWTSPHATLANLSTFVEAYGKTLLDGEHKGRTNVYVTPGFRFTLGGKHVLMFGVDIPAGGPRPNDELFRFTWIANF